MDLQIKTKGALIGSQVLQLLKTRTSELLESSFENVFHPTDGDGAKLEGKAAASHVKRHLERTSVWQEFGGYQKDAAGILIKIVVYAEKNANEEFCFSHNSQSKAKSVLSIFLGSNLTEFEIIGDAEKKEVRVVRASSESLNVNSVNGIHQGGFRVLLSISPLDSSDDESEEREHAELLAKLLSHAIDECDFDFKWHIIASSLELDTRHEVVDSIHILFKQLRVDLSEFASDLPINSVVALHIAPLRRECDAPSIYTATDISRLKFDEYADALRCKEAPQPPIILVSSSAYELLRHRFTFEPVGERSGAPVYRLWAEMQLADSESSSKVRDAAYSCKRFVDLPVEGPNAEQAVQDQARSLVNLLAEEDEPGIVLHWQCTHDRRTDILRPIDESLGHLLGMTFRTEFKGGSAAGSQPVDFQKRVRSFLEGWVGAEQCEQHSRVLISLLAGGDDREDFENVVPAISALLMNLALSQKVRVVIEATAEPDELVLKLRDFLRDDLPRNANIQLFHVWCSSSSPECPPTVGDRTNDDTSLLLQIAAVLGTDFQLAWLESCWKTIAKENHGDLQNRFDRALDESLLRGSLQFCDSLVTQILDARKTEAQYQSIRQVKWVNRSNHNSIDADFQHQVVAAFWDSFRSTTSQEPPSVSSLRLKARTFDILNSSINFAELRKRVDPIFMAELALCLGHRARAAGAPVEARDRLHRGIAWWKLATEQQRKSHYHIGRNLAQASLELWSEDRSGEKAEDDPGFALADECLSDIPHDDLCDSNSARIWFSLARSAWSIQNWSGPLTEAERHAKTMYSIAEHIKGGTQLEAWHALAVTQFAQGNLNECKSSARDGVDYCRTTAHLRSNDEHIFGSHDGRACCKALAGLCDIIKTGRDTDKLVEEAVTFAKNLGNKETYRVACGYKAMSELILGRFKEAMDTCGASEHSGTSQRPRDLPTSQRWEVFTELLSVCAAIAERVMSRAASGGNDLASKIESLRTKWRVREYDSLWLTFEALALWIDPKGATEFDEKFHKSTEIAKTRGETVFLPLTYLWWARVKARSNKLDEAAQHIHDGLDCAAQIGSTFWAEQLIEERVVAD